MTRPGSSSIAAAVALGFVLAWLCAGAWAQQTVYKWVDKDGVIHMSDERPPESEAVEVEVITTAPAPPVPAAPPAVRLPRNESAVAEEPAPAQADPLPVVRYDIADMTLDELDARCDRAREAKIAPLREAEIEKCKAGRRNDPAWCERFNATFGDAIRTANGTMGPRMFDDLPECVDALNERNRRPR
jgi:hypothetical protein